MGISTKHRRKITVDGEEYLWWVAPDDEDWLVPGTPAVTVAKSDHSLLVRYHLGQPEERRHVTVLGPRFRGLAGCGGPWRRFQCPSFEDGGAVRPLQVAALVRWVVEVGPVVEVNYLGLPISTAT